MFEIKQVLAAITGVEHTRIAALTDATIHAMPGWFSVWLRHLVDNQHDGRTGWHYPPVGLADAIDESEIDASINASVWLHVGTIDPCLASLLVAPVPVLTRMRPRTP